MAVPLTPPEGYHSVTPRLVVDDLPSFVAFINQVFELDVEASQGRPTEVRIGDSLLMVSETGERDAFPAFLYVYVDDADATFDRAVTAGATVIESPVDVPYGDRRAMVSDPWGNIYQLAHRLAQ